MLILRCHDHQWTAAGMLAPGCGSLPPWTVATFAAPCSTPHVRRRVPLSSSLVSRLAAVAAALLFAPLWHMYMHVRRLVPLSGYLVPQFAAVAAALLFAPVWHCDGLSDC